MDPVKHLGGNWSDDSQTSIFAESILAEYGIRWITKAGITKVEEGRAHYETLDGGKHVQDFDFAMLIPSFAGAGMKAFDSKGEDITSKLFAPSGFMKVAQCDENNTPQPLVSKG